MVIKFICDFIVDASFLYLVDSGYIKAMANKRVDMSKESDDYDSPWKIILEAYFKEFVAFFFRQQQKKLIGQEGIPFWIRNCSR